ncbi:hypothetical protein GSA37_003676 [Salmonella enterica]|uniref:DNA-directed RNA polymerase, beta subunit/140 kD subunit n=1 Tax=Salmonella enterica subsp. enterica serovar Javiana TaxID=363569 RepID=A0A733Y9R9_SALET|nr:hypothetical protein [Salmonella enterica subsp. enterica serovar Javiana]EBA9399108.1 hypothetical protein [Salmonella enterica]EBY8519366.1 hypothetical protein [Salmonella enterica subsp. enterica serovar Braenderup]ECD6767711.1 hypothetical protein [Salmonella enterica subsp. enterica serovar Newport]EHE0685223.1 hypothetical protein [Salmonella enterica subsp. enterica serovar Eastbourne]
MRMLKCLLANNREGHFVTAEETMSAPGQVWSCASCGYRLVLHASSAGDPAWFEHDTQTVARDVLMNCAWLDPEVKAEARHRKLRSIIGGLDTPVTVLSWYCVWCENHYQGKKGCVPCGTGIYSIEDTNTGNP